MFKFPIAKNVYLIFEREEYDHNSKEECYSCYGSGKQYVNDGDDEESDTEEDCYNCNGSGEIYLKKIKYNVAKGKIKSITLSGQPNSPTITYSFNKINFKRSAIYGTRTALESNVFDTEEEAVEKCKELNNV